jgi:alpha-L-arabinofuranosidase
MFGLMFEEINHSGDGGIYGELISNRNFQTNPVSLDDWFPLAGSKQQSMTVDTAQPVNKTGLGFSLRLTVKQLKGGQRVGVYNDGFYGIPVRAGTTYHASFYARSSANYKGGLKLSLETSAGKTWATAQISALTTGWRRYTATLTTAANIKPSEDNVFALSATHTGTVWLSLVSLFPPTYDNRSNGMRIDLMQDLAALHPGFLRFPGGNFLEGQTLDTRFNWKKTIGPLSQRLGHQDDAWGYYSSDGLGLLEYLEWCEDLHMTPVLAVYAGYSLGGAYVKPGPALRPYVQDALDEIQYATGSATTPWGARRAADGHPAPFSVPYVEVGNEDFFDKSGSYDGRFAQFYDAIRKTYPAIKIMATTDVTSRRPDIYDQHFYNSPDWFVQHDDYYDSYSRSAPKIFVGEYAAQNGPIAQGTSTLEVALGEAAWITGLERNADVVIMSSYAPLFQNLNGFQWTPDLISYDALSSYGSPSYYVQELFSQDHGDVVVPTSISGNASLAVVASKVSANGTIYITVVNTSAAAQSAQLTLKGAARISTKGVVTILTSKSTEDQNSLATPTKVAPKSRAISGLGSSFSYTFAPNSVTVLQLAAES